LGPTDFDQECGARDPPAERARLRRRVPFRGGPSALMPSRRATRWSATPKHGIW